MKKKSKNFIETQNVRVEERQNESSADSNSPYAQYVARSSSQRENPRANPDVLADTTENHLWGVGDKPELAQLIIERFADEKGYFPVLTKRQNEVLRLYLLGMDAPLISKELKKDYRNVVRSLKQIQRRFQRLLKAVDL